MEKHKFADARRLYEKASRMGDAESAFHAAQLWQKEMLEGQRTICAAFPEQEKQTLYRQFTLYLQGAQGGYLPAVLMMVKLYREGCVLFAPDRGQMTFWLRKAAQLGDADAKKALTTED